MAALEYTGGIPFEILRPVLERATPKQLLNLEDYNHYLLEDSDVLWEVHCRRDFKKVVSLGLFKCLATNKRVEEQARERMAEEELEITVWEEEAEESVWGKELD